MRHRPDDHEENESDGFEEERRNVRNDDEQFAAERKAANHRRVLDDARHPAHQPFVNGHPRQKSGQ